MYQQGYPQHAIPMGGPQGLPVRPVMQPHVQYVQQTLMGLVQQTAQTTPARQVMASVLTQNSYNNQEFMDQSMNALEYADMLIHTQRMYPQDAIALACTEVLKFYTSKLAIGNQQVFYAMQPAEQQQIQLNVQEQAQVGQAIRQYMAQFQAATYAAPSYSMPARGGYGVPAPAGVQMSGGVYAANTVPSWVNGQQPGQVYGQGVGYGHQPPQANGTTFLAGNANTPLSPLTAARGAVMGAAGVQHMPAPPPAPIPVSAPVPASGSPFATAAETQAAVTATVTATNQKEPVQVQIIATRAKEVQQLAGCGVNLNSGTERTYCNVFSPATEVGLYVLGVDGKYTESYKPLTAENRVDYKAHENEMFFRPSTREDQAHTPDLKLFGSALQQVTATQSIEDLMALIDQQTGSTELADVAVLPTFALELDAPCITSSSEDFRSAIELRIDGSEFAVDPLTSAISATCYTPRSFSVPTTKASAILAFEMVSTWSDILYRLLALRDVIPAQHWRKLEQDITDQVNEILNVKLLLDTRIDGFCLDIESLPAHLQKHRGHTLALAFEESARDVLRTTLCPQYAELYIEAIGLYPEEGNELTSEEMGMAGFATYTDVTLIPLHSRDFGLAYSGVAGRVTARNQPLLFKACQYRLSRAHPQCRHVVFVTIDGGVIYIHRTTVDDTIVITRGA